MVEATTKNMHKLLVVTTIPATLNFFLHLTQHLREQGWQVDAMAKELSASQEYSQLFDRVWDVDLSRNPLSPQNLIVAPQQIRAVLLHQDYDIVNVTTPVAAFVTRYALNGLRERGKVKAIYTAQGFHFYRGGSVVKNSIFMGLEKLAGSWTDYLVVVNREDEEAAKRYRFIPNERVCHIPGTGLNVDRFNRNAISEAKIMQIRQELGLQPKNSLFLAVAELIPRKHPQDILRAFARIDRSDVHLAFAGNGRLMGKMQQLALKLGIQNQVHFLGLRQDIPALMRTSVATLLASEQEGLPNCVMESLCMETPVIGTDIRGTRDLLEDGCGLLFKVGDVEALAKAMAWILDNPKAARIMSERGRERIADYERSHIIKQYQALYCKALSLI